MVRHILKDGKEVKDISGHMVKVSEFKAVYRIISQIGGKTHDKRIRSEKLA